MILYKILYLSLYLWGFEKVIQDFYCEKEMETEHKL